MLLGILFFVVLAGVLLAQLNSLFGRDVGSPTGSAFEKRSLGSADSFAEESSSLLEDAADNVISEEMRRVYPGFNSEIFLRGACAAFVSIQKAYISGDRASLRDLLAPELYRTFRDNLSERDRRGEVWENLLLEVRSVTLRELRLQGRDIRARVLFVSDQCIVSRNDKGEVLAGSPDIMKTVTDLWEFTRELASRSSKWYLTETSSVEEDV